MRHDRYVPSSRQPRAKGKWSSEGGPSQGDARANLYDEVTGRILAQLREGRLPWVQPWGLGGATSAALPRNACSGRRYSGINILILWSAVIDSGYPTQDWLTFRQARDIGGSVRKGEKGTGVVYADRFTPETEKARAAETGEDPKSVPFLKRFTQRKGPAWCYGTPYWRNADHKRARTLGPRLRGCHYG